MRRIKKAKITFISLVPRGANKLPVIYKADDSTVEFSTLIKESGDFMEKGELLAVVYAPEHRDSQGDIASASVIKEMAYQFQKDGGQIDIRHDGKALTKDDAYVAENFIVQKGDPRFEEFKDNTDKAVDVTGAWAQVIKIQRPDLRTKFREKEWGGVSMFGTAEVEPELSKFERVLEMFEGRLTTKEEEDMKPEEIQALVEKAVAASAKAQKDEQLKKEEEARKEAEAAAKAGEIKFEGDPSNAEDVAKHAEKLAKADLLKGVDFSDPKSVADYQEKLAEVKKDESKEDSDEVKELKAKLEKAQKASAQSNSDDKDKDKDKGGCSYAGMTLLSKEEQEAWAVGEKIGDQVNQNNGYEVKTA